MHEIFKVVIYKPRYCLLAAINYYMQQVMSPVLQNDSRRFYMGTFVLIQANRFEPENGLTTGRIRRTLADY
jgi:hypothetical protein